MGSGPLRLMLRESTWSSNGMEKGFSRRFLSERHRFAAAVAVLPRSLSSHHHFEPPQSEELGSVWPTGQLRALPGPSSAGERGGAEELPPAPERGDPLPREEQNPPVLPPGAGAPPHLLASRRSSGPWDVSPAICHHLVALTPRIRAGVSVPLNPPKVQQKTLAALGCPPWDTSSWRGVGQALAQGSPGFPEEKSVEKLERTERRARGR